MIAQQISVIASASGAPGGKNEAVESWSLIPCDTGFDPESDESIDGFVEKYGLNR